MPSKGSNGWIRRLAGLKFTTSQQSITLAELAQDPDFHGKVNVRVLRSWCLEDGWIRKREQYYNNFEEYIRRQVAEKQTQAIVDQLQILDDLGAKAREILNTGGVEPGSYEGMVNAVLRLEQQRTILIDRIAKEVAPTGTAAGIVPGAGGVSVRTSISPEEAREIALEFVRRRKAQEDRQRLEVGSGS